MQRLNAIWNSFLNIPKVIAIWMMLILMPANFLTLLFLGEPLGMPIAVLAVTGLLLNLPLILRDRGFTSSMSVPHVLTWVPLTPLLLYVLWGQAGDISHHYRMFLWSLLVINSISLCFDVRDSLRLLKGQKETF